MNNPVTNQNSLQDNFLISMPQLNDPSFTETVVLICKHDESGALGIVINRFTEHNLKDIFMQLDIETSSTRYQGFSVLEGGPVYPELGLVIHTGSRELWESSLPVSDDLVLTSSRDILESMARGIGPERALMSLGYAGWGAGQLEMEIQANAWLTAPVDKDILFSMDITEKWQSSARLLGVDIHQISQDAGHA
jgi:putative transcriptional regulator